MAHDCRIQEARHFAQTVGLYADGVIAVDHLTAGLRDPDDQLSAEGLVHLAIDTEVLSLLRPLIDAGVIRFARPTKALCSHCAKRRDSAIENTVESLLKELTAQSDVRVVNVAGMGRMLEVRSSLLEENGIRGVRFLRMARGAVLSQKTVGSALRQIVTAEVNDIVFCTESAVRCGATLTTNDRLGPAALRLLDGRTRGVTTSEWERQRRVPLPILEGLTPSQILALREEAASALPAFRQRIAQALSGGDDASDAASRKLAVELRGETAALEAELKAVNLPSVRRGGALLASAGFVLTVVGLAHSPAVAAVGMNALIQTAMHGMEQRRKAKGELIRLKAKPAYVTLVAERLREHAH